MFDCELLIGSGPESYWPAISRRALLGAFGTLIVSGAALAGEEDEKTDIINELLVLAQFDETAEAYTTEVADVVVARWKTSLSDPEASALAALKSELTRKLAADYLALKPQIVQLWRNAMTLDELRALLAFYKSPYGRSVLSKKLAIDQQVAKMFYPESAGKVEEYWRESVISLRRQGKKL